MTLSRTYNKNDTCKINDDIVVQVFLFNVNKYKYIQLLSQQEGHFYDYEFENLMKTWLKLNQSYKYLDEKFSTLCIVCGGR